MINLYEKITLRGTTWFIIKLACLTLVIVQTGANIRNKLFSGKTVTSTRVTKIFDVPLILNIIVKPGFNDTRLCEHGYDNAYQYFSGIVDEDSNCSRKAMDEGQIGKGRCQNILFRAISLNIAAFCSNQII